MQISTLFLFMKNIGLVSIEYENNFRALAFRKYNAHNDATMVVLENCAFKVVEKKKIKFAYR